MIETIAYRKLEEADESQYEIGNTINIDDDLETDYIIENVMQSARVAVEFGIDTDINIPIIILDKPCRTRKAAYDHSLQIILVFKNATRNSLHHEIIHSIEYHKEKTESLNSLYEVAKEKISEDSFENGFFSFNFEKSINEFIADGHSNTAFIEALKKEGLYERFINETSYLFEK